jgi:hypothetical protein
MRDFSIERMRWNPGPIPRTDPGFQPTLTFNLLLQELFMARPSRFRNTFLCLAFLSFLASSACVAQVNVDGIPSRPELAKTILRQPLRFEASPDGAFVSRASARRLRVDKGGVVTFATGAHAPISMELDGANPSLMPVGNDHLPGHSNYIMGSDQAKWRTNVDQFGRVQVGAVYPGIDLVYYGNGDQLEHDYLVGPNADPSQIRMRFHGASPQKDERTGDLILRQAGASQSDGGELRLRKPFAYQQAPDGTRKAVAVSYLARPNGDIGFSLGSYDHAQPLVIDPVILYSSYFGGNYSDSIVDIKLGSDNSIYVLLTTFSTDLKTVGAPSAACVGTCGPANPDGSSFPDMYVARLDPTGQTLLFATYLGGSNDDEAYNLALDSDGSIYVAGSTHSVDFPVINQYPGGTPAVGGNAVGTLSKLSADGSTLLYSTFIGYGVPTAEYISQVGQGTAHLMVAANNGIVYLIGQAYPVDPSDFIWQKNPLFTVGLDFLAKFDTTKTGTDSIVYATQVGDNNATVTNSAQLTALALDSKGDVWLYGQTSNTAFPTASAGALQSQCNAISAPSCNSSFLMEIDPSGDSVLYATYFGGSSSGLVRSYDIRIDASDDIYVSGSTSQSDFPIKNGAYSTLPNAAGSGYASKISPDGKTLLYSTYLYTVNLIAALSGGQLAFTGSYGPGFPVKNGLQTTPPSGQNLDAVFGLIDTTQSGADSLLLSSYLGTTTSYTLPRSVELASSGQILIAGQIFATDLPVVNAYQATCATTTCSDGFIVAIQPNDTLTLTPSAITFPSTSVGSTSAAMTATLFNGTTKSIYLIQGKLTDSKDFTAKDDCNGIMSPQASCTVTFTFTPQSAGTLTSTYSTGDLDNQSSLLTVTLTGASTAAEVSVSPTSLAFGSVADGSTATQSVTLTNSSSSAVPISGATVSGTGFSLTNNTCGASAAANATCQYSVTFSPTEQGPYAGTLTIVDSLGSQVVQLTATGTLSTASSTLTPATVAFGNVYEGQTATQTVTYTNTGKVANTFTAATINPPIFQISSTTCTSPVAAGASCTYTLSYAPFGVGSAEGSFTVTDGASNPSVAITGTGIQPINGDNVFLIPGSINFQNVVLGGSQAYPYANLTWANQTSQTIQAQSKNYFFAGTGTAVFGHDIGDANECQYAGNGDYTLTLAPYTSCVITIYFVPDSAVADTTYNAQFDINWNYVGDTQLHYLATALTANTISPPNAVVTPTSIQFPATPNGKTSAAQIVNVSNTGDQALGFAVTITGANPTAFTQTNNCPANLNKNDKCQVSVTFTPGATGNEFTGTLSLQLSTGEVDVALNGGISPSDFVLSSPAPTQGGTNPTWSLNIAPLTASIGFNEPIKFKVTGLDASYGTIVFTPSTVTPKGGTVTTTLTLTQTPSAAFNQKLSGPRTALPVLACCMAFFFSFRKRLKTYRSRLVMMLALVLLTTFAATGCGHPKPPVPFTVTATSGSISHDITLTLQP